MSHSLAVRPAVLEYEPLPLPLPPPPLTIREHVPPRAWSRVVPLSSRGRPLLARDRRPDEGAAIDRLARPLVGALAVLAVALAALLLL
jgi:hypothetical protein